MLCIGLSPQWFCDILFVACCCDKGLRGGLSLGRASVVSTIALCEGLSTLLMCFLAGLIRWAERLCSSAGVAGGGGAAVEYIACPLGKPWPQSRFEGVALEVSLCTLQSCLACGLHLFTCDHAWTLCARRVRKHVSARVAV